MAASASFSLLTTDTSALTRPLAGVARQVPRPTLGLLFVSGAIGQDRDGLIRALRAQWPGVPTLVVQGAGVMTEQGEHEGQAAAAGLLVSGPKPVPVWAAGVDEGDPGLAQPLQQAGGAGTLLMFVAQTQGATQLPGKLMRAYPGLSVLGGGAATTEPQLVLDADGRVHQGTTVGMLLRGPAPLVATSPGCRVLGGLRTVTEVRGSMLLRIDGEPALDVLSQAARSLEGKPLVMVLLPDPAASEAQARAEPARRARLRPVRGVDPERRGVLLGEPLREGDRIAFAALDGSAARHNLEGALRDLGRRTAGSAARFGLYVNCSGRGAALYGTPDVDCKQIRSRFPGLPFIGVMSSFEIGPVPEAASVHYYTGVFGLFTAPS